MNNTETENKQQEQKPKTHYHVLAGFYGCLPEHTETYRTKKKQEKD